MSSGLSITRDFVSQDQIDQAREKRAEEWKKAYESGNTDAEAPPEEEEYDPRTLYEKIAANKQKKEDEFAEATRLSNLIHRIDEDESDFLTTLQTVEQETRRDKLEKEKLELNEFRRAVAESTLHTPSVDPLPSTPQGSEQPVVPIPAAKRKRSSIEKTILESGVIIKKTSKRKNENNNAAEDEGSGMKKKQLTVLPEKAKERETKGPLQSLVSYGGDSDAEESDDEGL